jgi:hypothetical protein
MDDKLCAFFFAQFSRSFKGFGFRLSVDRCPRRMRLLNIPTAIRIADDVPFLSCHAIDLWESQLYKNFDQVYNNLSQRDQGKGGKGSSQQPAMIEGLIEMQLLYFIIIH